MIRPPVRSIIHWVKLVDYLSVQADKPCSISYMRPFSVSSHIAINIIYTRMYSKESVHNYFPGLVEYLA